MEDTMPMEPPSTLDFIEILGTDAEDTLFGTNRLLIGDHIFAGKGNDTVHAGRGDDIVYGGWGNDKLSGEDGNDWLFGQSGNDSLDGGSGADVMIGGNGDDTYVVDDIYDEVHEYPDFSVNGRTDVSIDSVSAFFDYTLDQYVENLSLEGNAKVGFGNDGNNSIHGNSAWDNELHGGDGADHLFGNGGQDHLFGDGGNDELDGLTGADVMAGGLGDDTYHVDDVHDEVIENVNEGFDDVWSFLPSYTLGPNVENLYLRVSALNGFGNDLDNKIYGNDAGNLISGALGNDELAGGGGDDWIYGDGDNDLIIGGAGLDNLYGGSGTDIFVWSGTSETPASPNNQSAMDVIHDFNPTESDKIDLHGMAVEAGLPQLTFDASNHNPNTFTAPGQVRFEQDAFTLDIRIWINTDSDAQADAGIAVSFAGFTPDASWFFL